MVICPLCRSEHCLPKNGFFPSDITRVNFLEILTKSDKRGGKNIYKVFREVL